MKGNALRRFIAVFIVVAMMLTPVLALAEEADLGIEAPVAETGATLGEETTTDNAPEGESAPVEAESASVDDADSEEYDIEITKAGTYSKTVNVGDTISASLDMDDVEIVSCSATGSNVIEMDYDETSIEIAAVGAGSAKVTAKLSNKKTVTISVKVVNPYEPKKVSFAESTYTLAVGDLLDLYDEVEYDGITTLTFSTSSKSVAPVDKTTGEVVGKKAGKATITVKTSGGKTAKCTVKVVGNELKDIFKKPTKAQIRNLCEGGWTFLPRNIKYNNKGGIDCEFYLLNGTSYKTRTIENLNLSLLVDGEVIAAYDFGSRKVSASKYGYKSFKVSFPASSVEEVVFLPYVVEDLLIGVDEDIYVLASNKDELEFIPVDDVHEEGTEPGPTPPTPTPTKVTSVTLAPETLTLSVGETSTVVASVKPDNATDKTLNWKSSDEKVATVANGVVTAVAAGTANIIATANDGSGKSATCAVTVANIVGGLSVTMEETSKTLKVGDTATLTAVVLPPACQDTLVWASSDDTIAKVDSKTGVVTAVKAGSATITATATMDTTTKSASCAITVEAVTPTKNVTLDKETATVAYNGSIRLVATTKDGKAVSWTSSNKSIADVDSNGLVIGKSATYIGKTVNIIATDGTDSATCVVTITGAEVKKVELPDSGTVEAGKTVRKTVSVLDPVTEVVISPATGYDLSAVVYKSSDESVATVSATTTGFSVKGIKAGKVYISAYNSKGESISKDGKQCEFTVTSGTVYPTSIYVDKQTVTLKVGDKEALFVKYSPEDCTEKDFTVTSSNTSVATYSKSEGIITAVSEGTAHITFVGEADTGKTKPTTGVDVIVTAATDPTSDVPVTSFTISPSTGLSLEVGGSAKTVKATIHPSNASNPELVWTNSDDAVVQMTVAADTKSASFKALKSGSVKIAVKAVDKPNEIKTFVVRADVAGKKPVKLTIEKSISSQPDIVDMQGISANYPLRLKATVTYSDGSITTPSVVWSVSPTTGVAVVTDGVVTGLVDPNKTGTATITAKYTDPTTDMLVQGTYAVTVVNKVHPTSVTLTETPIKPATALSGIYIGQSVMLTANVEPDTAVDKSVTFTSMDTSVATVDNSGKVTAVGKGSTTIVVKTVDQAGSATAVQALAQVNVKQPITSITLDKTGTLNWKYGQTGTITATALPTTHKGTVLWKSSNTSIVNVPDPTVGNLVAQSTDGTAIITAYAEENESVLATVTIKVTEKAIGKVSNINVQQISGTGAIKVSWTGINTNTSKGDHYKVYLMSGSTVLSTYTPNVAVGTNTATFTKGTGDNAYAFESGKSYSVAIAVMDGTTEGELSDAFTFTYN